MTPILTPVAFCDFEEIQLRNQEHGFIVQQGGIHNTEALCKVGAGWTLRVDNEVIAIGGFVPLWEGNFELWLFPSYKVSAYSIIFLRAVKRIIQEIENTYSPHRLQTHTIADELHDRWMLFLGFEYEGFLKQFSWDKQDYRIWSRVYNVG